MALSLGIVGLPNVGKSTLFQTITKKQVDCSNYPFCTIEPNIGVVAVPDERVDKLAELLGSAKKIYTTIEFVDIAGLVKGASQGEGLGNKFLAEIRQTDAIIYVLRAFRNENIINTRLTVNPVVEKEILDTELILKDLETVNKRIEDLEKEAKAGKKEAIKELAVLTKVQNLLEKSQILAEVVWGEEDKKIIDGYQLLMMKPRLYLLNGRDEEVPVAVTEAFQKNKWPFLIIDLLTELQAADLSREERQSLNLPLESELEVLIKKSYELLDLITFFTTLSNETRAWPLKRGKKIPAAGGVIHTDFEEKFIKAEVVNWQELVVAGGASKAREKGRIRTEGKEYVVQDGDVIEIRI